jgi:hypothetical protein
MNTGVVVHDIQPTGALTAHPGSPFMVPLVETLSLALDEANDRMVVGCRCSGGVVCLLNGVNSGNLVYVQDIPTGANQPICLDIFNDRLYVTHEGGPVGVIDLPPGGPYIAVPGSPFTPVGSMSGVSSHWLYRATGLAPGLIQIDYEVDDAESDPLTLTAEFSTDGVSFAPATMGPGSDPMSGIVTVAGTPQAYFFVWDAAIDLGPGGSPTAHVRLTPADSVGSGAPCTVGPFAVP